MNAAPLPRGLKFLPEIASHLVPESMHLGTYESMTTDAKKRNRLRALVEARAEALDLVVEPCACMVTWTEAKSDMEWKDLAYKCF